ncbi:MAG: hypothetical protein U1F49_04325 [Rubrivivax sp.]
MAFARLLHRLDPEAPPSLLLAGALAAQMEGRGHGASSWRGSYTRRAAQALGFPGPHGVRRAARAAAGVG